MKIIVTVYDSSSTHQIMFWFVESISESIHRHGVYGFIESPGFPNDYPNHANITWETFGPIDAISLTVTILHFDLYSVPGSQCSDKLTVQFLHKLY